MKRKVLLAVFLTTLLSSCGPKCDHIDENHDHICDYCGKEMPNPTPYAEWPEKEIQDLVIVVSGSEAKIPHYTKADEIEVNEDHLVSDGYFSIFCYVEDDTCENEYKQILIDAGWDVESSKDAQGFYNAWDKDYEVWLNFGFFEENSDLEINATASLRTKWPEKDIADGLQIVVPGTKTEIPEFKAYAVVATYNSFVNAVAINAIGCENTIVDDYKSSLINAGWNVFYNNVSTEWNAISAAKDVEIHFYLDSDNYFNVDVFGYKEKVEGWPYDEIQEAIEYLDADGEVLPFTGENTGFKVDWNYPIAIFIYCSDSQKESAKNAYNQSLIDAGYIYTGDMFGEPVYAKPGTTLGMRAVIMMEVLQIELFKLDTPAA